MEYQIGSRIVNSSKDADAVVVEWCSDWYKVGETVYYEYPWDFNGVITKVDGGFIFATSNDGCIIKIPKVYIENRTWSLK